MKSLFEEMGGTYRQEGDYLIPNLALPGEPEYQIGKYGRMRRSYLKEHRPVLYASLLTSGTLHRHLAEIDQACNERMEIIVSDMARQEDVTEALKAADQMEWVHRMNSIRSRAEEIILREMIYGEDAGLHLLLTAKGNVTEQELLERAAAEKVKAYGMSENMVEATMRKATVLLGFGSIDEVEMQEGLRRLQKAWL